jgi:hypothetical protein
MQTLYDPRIGTHWQDQNASSLESHKIFSTGLGKAGDLPPGELSKLIPSGGKICEESINWKR